MSSVSDEILLGQGIEVKAFEGDRSRLVSEKDAEAAARRGRLDDVPLKETKLVTFIGYRDPQAGDIIERPAWAFSFAIVPPFQGGAWEEGGRWVDPEGALTTANTYFVTFVDAETGEVILSAGGTLVPVIPIFVPHPKDWPQPPATP